MEPDPTNTIIEFMKQSEESAKFVENLRVLSTPEGYSRHNPEMHRTMFYAASKVVEEQNAVLRKALEALVDITEKANAARRQ